MKKRHGADADMVRGMEVLTETDLAKAKADAVQDAIILREVDEMMRDLCPNNVQNEELDHDDQQQSGRPVRGRGAPLRPPRAPVRRHPGRI